MKEDKKVKVLNIVCGLSTEGIGTFLVNMYENIDKERFDIDFALSTHYKQYHEDTVLKRGANVYRTYEIGDGVLGIIKHFINLIKILKSEGPYDVVHTHMDFFNGINLLAAYVAGVPKRISHAHISCKYSHISVAKSAYYKFMKFLINRFSTNKVGCSFDANMYLNSEEGEIIYNGINLEKFSCAEDFKSVDIKLDNNKINFITIGRIDSPKNPLFTVEIIKELVNIRNNIHLYWIGTGSMEQEVKELVIEYKLENNITFLGRRPDVNIILNKMDYMIFPSKYEGLGIALIESQVAKVPCFISDVIPMEANLGMCTRIKLSLSAKQWAMKIDDYINNGNYNSILDEEKTMRFDIKTVSKRMEEIYLA